MIVGALKSLYLATVDCSGFPSVFIVFAVAAVITGAVFAVNKVLKMYGGGKSGGNPFGSGYDRNDIDGIFKDDLPQAPPSYKTESFEELKKKRAELEKQQKIAELKAEAQANWGQLAKPETPAPIVRFVVPSNTQDEVWEYTEGDEEIEDDDIEETGEYEDEGEETGEVDENEEIEEEEYEDGDIEETDGDGEIEDEDIEETGEYEDGEYIEKIERKEKDYEWQNTEQAYADEKPAFQQDGEQTREPPAGGVPPAAEASAQPEYPSYPVSGIGTDASSEYPSYPVSSAEPFAPFIGAGGSLETGRVVSVSPPGADGLCRVMFSIQTFGGAIESTAAVASVTQFTVGSPHYVMLADDGKTCRVL